MPPNMVTAAEAGLERLGALDAAANTTGGAMAKEGLHCVGKGGPKLLCRTPKMARVVLGRVWT